MFAFKGIVIKEIMSTSKELSNLKSVLNRVKYYFAGNLVTALSGFISLAILTRLLTVEQFGLISVFNSLVSIFSIVIGLNLSQSVTRYYFDFESDIDSFICSILVVLFCVSGAFICIGFLFSEFWSSIFDVQSDLIILVAIVSLSRPIHNVYERLMIAKGESRSVAFYASLSSLGILLSGMLGVILVEEKQAESKIIFEIIFKICFSLFILYLLSVSISKLKVQKKHISYAFKFALPRLPFSLSSLILNNFDRLMLNSMIGLSAAGIYSVGYSLGMVSVLLISAITPAMVPEYYKYMELKEYEVLDKLNQKLFFLVMALSFLVIAFSQELAFFLVDKKYEGAVSLVPIIVIGYIFHGLTSIYSRVYDYEKKTVVLSFISVLTAVLNIVLNWYFIPSHGFVGAAFTTLFSFVVMFLLTWASSKYMVKVHTTPLYYLVVPFCLFVTFYIALVLCGQYLLGVNLIIAKILLASVFLLVNYIFIFMRIKTTSI